MSATAVIEESKTSSRTRIRKRAALRFTPHYQPRIWGGNKLRTQLHRELPQSSEPIGESWEISDRPECQSSVVEGEFAGLTINELWNEHRQEIFGRKLARHPSSRYPLLMKVLDAGQDLSVQVHPPEGLAALLGGEPKTEVWYVASAEPGSRIYAGVRQGVDMDRFADAVDQGRCEELLHSFEAEADTSLLLPSGRVHALGAGLLVFEIQQNSDTTYRVFDWNRTDSNGVPRELHIDVALECIDFRDAEPMPRVQVDNGIIAKCPHFEVYARSANAGETWQLGEPGEHLVMVLVRGRAEAAGLNARPGDFLMIPAHLDRHERQVIAFGAQPAKWLEVRIPNPPVM